MHQGLDGFDTVPYDGVLDGGAAFAESQVPDPGTPKRFADMKGGEVTLQLGGVSPADAGIDAKEAAPKVEPPKEEAKIPQPEPNPKIAEPSASRPSTPATPAVLREFMGMGFSKDEAEAALAECENDSQKALKALLDSKKDSTAVKATQKKEEVLPEDPKPAILNGLPTVTPQDQKKSQKASAKGSGRGGGKGRGKGRGNGRGGGRGKKKDDESDSETQHYTEDEEEANIEEEECSPKKSAKKAPRSAQRKPRRASVEPKQKSTKPKSNSKKQDDGEKARKKRGGEADEKAVKARKTMVKKEEEEEPKPVRKRAKKNQNQGDETHEHGSDLKQDSAQACKREPKGKKVKDQNEKIETKATNGKRAKMTEEEEKKKKEKNAERSRKSSAYVAARKEALENGHSEDEAKKIGRAVAQLNYMFRSWSHDKGG